MYGYMQTAGTGTEFTLSGAERDVIILLGDATAIAFIHEIRVGQGEDAGDAQAEMLRIEIHRTTSAGAGTAETETPLLDGGPAAVCEVRTNCALSTGLTLLMSDVFNVQAGWHYLPIPTARISVPSSATEGICVRIAQPDDELTLSASIVWEEIPIT